MKINTVSDLGTLIKQKRKQINMTQSDAAGLCNVGIRFLSDLENGKPTIQFDKALYVAKIFGFDLFAEDKK